MADLSTRPEPTTDAAAGEVSPDALAPPTPSSDATTSAPGTSSESPTASEPTPAASTAETAPSGAKAELAEADVSVPGSGAEETDKPDRSAAVPSDATVESAAAPDTTHTDAPDTKSDGPEPDRSGAFGSAVPARRKRSRPSVLVTSLAAVLVVLVGAGVALMLHNRALTSAAADRIAALQVAQAVAINLTTFSPQDVASQIQTLNSESTGSFRDQIAGYSEAFQAVLKQGDVKSTGTISAAGIEKFDGDTAAAVVTVAARLTSAQNPQGEPRSYRLTIGLQRNDDKWLASNVNFVQ